MYTIVIDESGDTGVKDVEPDPSRGPSQYFCLCATIFREENRRVIEDVLKSLPFGNGVPHASNLNHFQKVHYCKSISKLPIGMIGVISNKLSLLDYQSDASKTSTHFYNKVMQYLLELIGQLWPTLQKQGSDVRIILELRAQRYSSLFSFIEKIQQKPFDIRSIPIKNINRFSITTQKKSEDLCLALSDIGAHSMFSAVRRDERNFGHSEPRYLYELRSIFYADKRGKILPKGIKPIHSIATLSLPQESSDFLTNFRNPKLNYHRLT